MSTNPEKVRAHNRRFVKGFALCFGFFVLANCFTLFFSRVGFPFKVWSDWKPDEFRWLSFVSNVVIAVLASWKAGIEFQRWPDERGPLGKS